MAKNAAGREWQVATIQLDMNIPERFDLTCINEKGGKERIVMIHAAISGSIERCAAILLEHFDGKLPLWLSPVQVTILPVGESHQAYAKEVHAQLKAAGIRAELSMNESLGKRIRGTKEQRVPCFIVVGDKEVAEGTITVENNRNGDKAAVSVADFITPTLERIKERANI